MLSTQSCDTLRQHELRALYALLELVDIRLIKYEYTSLTNESRSQNKQKDMRASQLFSADLSKPQKLREGNESRHMVRRLKQIRLYRITHFTLTPSRSCT